MSAQLVEYPLADARALGDRITRRIDGLLHYRGLTPSLTELLDVQVHRFAGREAVVEVGGQRLTYRELWGSAARVAGGLLNRGIGLGDRVAIVYPNGARWVQAFLGALLSGAVPVPIDVRLRGSDRDHVLADSAVDFVLDGELPDGTAFIDDGASLGELAVLCYTRGRTGRPKGVELSNENILSAIETVVAATEFGCTGVRNLVLMPLAHASGCIDQLLPTLAVGGTVVVASGPENRRAALADEGVDVVSSTPDLFAEALSGDGFEGHDVRRVCSSGALGGGDASRLRAAFPDARQLSWWGATETSGIALALSDDVSGDHPGSVGTAFGGTELALLGPAAAAGTGELLCRGPNIMRGYWRNPTATAAMFTGNWFRTGEFAHIADDGYVRLVEQTRA